MELAAGGTDEPMTRGRGALLALLATVVVAALVVAAAGASRVSAAAGRADRRSAVLAAARQQAVSFTTLDYRHLDRDLGRVLDGAAGDFRQQFRAGTDDLSALVTKNKAVSRGEVLDAGIVSDDADSARVLVVADSTVTNAAQQQPQQRHYRMQLDLVRSGGRWLVSDLQFVG